MSFTYRNAEPSDFNRCVEIRGKTKDNPVSKEILEAWGVNKDNWPPLIKNKSILGIVCESSNTVIGYSNGDVNSGEVLVLAVLPEYEKLGIGKQLLSMLMQQFFLLDINKLWLAASPSPEIRAHGFYRHMG